MDKYLYCFFKIKNIKKFREYHVKYLRARILAVIFAGAILIAIDGSTISPILESIRKSFGVNENLITWIFNIQILCLLISTPIMAKISDKYGRRNIYVLNSILFLVGLLIVVFSQSYEMLLIGRALQGIEAVLSVLAITIIGDYFDETRGTILGAFGVIIAFVYALGPAISGFLVNFSWNWVFIINISVAVVVIFLGYYLLTTGKVTEKYSHFDSKGMNLTEHSNCIHCLLHIQPQRNFSGINPISSTYILHPSQYRILMGRTESLGTYFAH